MTNEQIEAAVAVYAEKLKDTELDSEMFEEYIRRINKLRSQAGGKKK